MTSNLLIEALVLFAAAFLGVLAASVFVKTNHNPGTQEKAGPSAASLQLLPLRIQAYERMIIFVGRMNPVNMLVRLHQQGISIQELQAGILNEIRQEYQHNAGQQLYISKSGWTSIKRLKDDTITMINNVVQQLPADATGISISKVVLQELAAMEQNPYDLTIDLLKADIQKLF